MTAEERSKIVEQLKDVFDRVSNGRAKISQVREEASILDDLGLYSLDLLELRYDLEEIWNVEIADEDAVMLQTVGDLVDLIVRHQTGDTS